MSEIPVAEYRSRLEKLKEKMGNQDIDALFIYSDHYRCAYTSYFMNYRPMDCTLNAAGAVFVPIDKDPTVFVSIQNMATCKKHCWIKDVRDIWDIENTIPKLLSEKKIKLNKIGVVGDELLPIRIFAALETAIPHADFEIRPDIVTDLMRVKSDVEIQLLKEAANLADLGVEEALRSVMPGKTESEIAAIAESIVVSRGGTIEEDTLVRSGDRTYPPGLLKYTNRKIKKGDFLTIDFHPSVEAYLGDLARTVIVNKGTQKQLDAIKYAHNLREYIAETINPGMQFSEIHQKVLAEVKKSNHFENWDVSFGTGRTVAHGLGIGEENWNNITEDSTNEISTNMTFAIRVNLVNIESQGVHFEDAAVVERNGTTFLNKNPAIMVV